MRLLCFTVFIYYSIACIVIGQQLLFLPFGRLGYVLRRLKQKESLRRQPVHTVDSIMQGKAYPTTVLAHSYKPVIGSTVTPEPNMGKVIVPPTPAYNNATAVNKSSSELEPEVQSKPSIRHTPTPASLVAPSQTKIDTFTPVVKIEQSYEKYNVTLPDTLEKYEVITESNIDTCSWMGNCTKSLKSYETKDDTSLYAYAHSSRLEPLLIGLYDATRTKELPPPLTWKTTVTPEFVQLTQNIMRLVKPNRVLVIGVYTGLGVLASALAINPRGLVVGIEYPQYLKYWEVAGDKFAQTAGLMRRIQIKADKPIPLALESLVSKEPGTFDFIILDDHALENYMMDYERALSLLRKGGAIIINDVLADGTVIGSNRSPGGQLMDQLNKKVRDDQRVSTTLLPFSGGISLVVKK